MEEVTMTATKKKTEEEVEMDNKLQIESLHLRSGSDSKKLKSETGRFTPGFPATLCVRSSSRFCGSSYSGTKVVTFLFLSF